MEDKMELLTLLLVLLISGCSYALHPRLTFTQNAELHKDDQTHWRSKHLKYVFVPVKVEENRVENITAESTERRKAEQEKGSEGITPNPLGKPVKNEKTEEERRGQTGPSSHTDSKKQTTEERVEQEEIGRRLVAGIRERKGAHRGKKSQNAERKKLRKAAKVEKIQNINQEEVTERQRKADRVVNLTTSTEEKKKSSIPDIFQIITQPQDPPPPPPHNGLLSPPFTPTQVPPHSSHLPTLYTQVSVSPPSVNTADPTSPSQTSGFTVHRTQKGVRVKSDLVFEEIRNLSLKLETPTGEMTRKINPGNKENKAGNVSTPQATPPKPREAKFTVPDSITEESNRFSKSNESESAELAEPANKPNTTRPTIVQPTELDTRVPVKQRKASIHQPHLSKPAANIYQTTAKTPPTRPTERVNKNRTTKTSKDKEDTGNKTQILSNMKEFNLLSFPFMDDYCPAVCTCHESVVQCSNKSVGKVPHGIPYGTRQIVLMNNYIKGIQLDLFAKYNSMEVLVLSNNWLTDGAIKGAFSAIRALKHLYLDGNRLKSVPVDLPVSLEELRLDNNYLKAISAGAWSRCPGLFILRLGNNNLGHGPDSFPDAVLSSLRNLHTLSLDHNQLSAVPLGLPPLIKELYLKGNLIQQVREDAFHKMWALQVLDLSTNRLTNAGLKNSLNATRLESLNLEGNRLEHVPRHLPPSLTSLSLEGNFISSIKKVDFSRLKKLELLGLARNKIFEVAPGAFRELTSLHRLDLCHNDLHQVPRQLPRALHAVALTHNKIQSVPHDAFCWGNKSRSLRGFVRMHLEHNVIDVGKMDARSFRCLQGFQLVHSF